MRKTDNWIKSFLHWTDNSEPVEIFREWVGVFTIASALQRKCPIMWASKVWYPNMYVVLVAPAGAARKGDAMKFGLELMHRVGIPLAADSITREALIEDLEASNCISYSAESQWISTHSSLTAMADELTVFLSQKEVQLVSDMQAWYDCKSPWIRRTKTQGTYPIRGMWLNFMGATTPSLMQTAFPGEALGGGWASRTIFVYADRVEKRVIFPDMDRQALQSKADCLHDLRHIKDMCGPFLCHKSWADSYGPWYKAIDSEMDGKEAYIQTYLERKPAHIFKVAACHCAGRTEDRILRDVDFIYAHNLLTRTERKLTKTFSMSGGNPEAQKTHQVLHAIFMSNERPSFKGLANTFFNTMDTRTLMNILYDLQRRGKIKLARGTDDYFVDIVCEEEKSES